MLPNTVPSLPISLHDVRPTLSQAEVSHQHTVKSALSQAEVSHTNSPRAQTQTSAHRGAGSSGGHNTSSPGKARFTSTRDEINDELNEGLLEDLSDASSGECDKIEVLMSPRDGPKLPQHARTHTHITTVSAEESLKANQQKNTRKHTVENLLTSLCETVRAKNKEVGVCVRESMLMCVCGSVSLLTWLR